MPLIDFISREEFEPVVEEVKRLRVELNLWKQHTDEYLSTAQAMRLLGCSRRWLEVERHRPGTKLIASYLNSKPTYSRASLLAIKAARTITPHQSKASETTRSRGIAFKDAYKYSQGNA